MDWWWKCDNLKVIQYDNSDNSKNQNEENYTEYVYKIEKGMKIIPIFLQMQNRKNLNLWKITMLIIYLKMKIKTVHHYDGYWYQKKAQKVIFQKQG